MKVRELANSAIADLGVGSQLLACKWVSDRYLELVTTRPIKPLRKVYELVVPAVISAGTISVTNDTDTVTGNATAAAAWSPDVVDRYFRADGSNEWYRISSITGSTIKLESRFVGSTVSAGGYKIVARRHTLAPRLRHIGVMVNLHLGTPLTLWPLDKLDRIDPRRSTTSGGPLIYTELSVDDEWNRLVELYPPDTSKRLIAYTGYEDPAPLQPDSTIPSFIDSHWLRIGVRQSILSRESVEQIRQGKAEQGAVLANLAAREGTEWKTAKDRFIQQAHATDDSTVILGAYGAGRKGSGDIATARDHVYAAWSPLVDS